MNNFKITFASVVLTAFLSLNIYATEVTPLSSNPASIQEQVSKYLQGIDFSGVDDETAILVDFIITDKNELMILSTNSEANDATIKARLNYKKLSSHDLERNKTYTLPIKYTKA